MPRHGENIYKRRDGRYEGRYVIGKTAGGKTKFGYIYGYQYTEVRCVLLQKKAECLERSYCPQSRLPLLKDWLKYWLENEILGCVKDTSFQVYRRQIEGHLLPRLGHFTLPELTPAVIYDFASQLEASGLAYSTIKSIFRLLNASLRYAQEEGLILKNPCKKIKIHPREASEQRVLDRSEQEMVRNEALAQNDLPTLLSLYTGMRLGEVCALKWADIDWERKTIAVRRTVQRLSKGRAAEPHTFLTAGAPKSKRSNRLPSVPDFFASSAEKGVSGCDPGRHVRFRQGRPCSGTANDAAKFSTINADIGTCQRSFSHTSSQLCHTSAGTGRRYSNDQRFAGSSIR